MKEQFVTYEIALKLKELGFKEILSIDNTGYFYYDDYLNTGIINLLDRYDERPGIYIAPLWQQVIDWFTKEHNLRPQAIFYDTYILGVVTDIKDSDDLYSEYFDDFYIAQEQAILKAIQLCKKEK